MDISICIQLKKDTKIDVTEFILFFSIRIQNWIRRNVEYPIPSISMKVTMTDDIKFNTTNNAHHLSYLKIIYMTNDNDINLILIMMYPWIMS